MTDGCPNTAQLHQFVAGTLASVDDQQISAHLRSCVACTADADGVQYAFAAAGRKMRWKEAHVSFESMLPSRKVVVAVFAVVLALVGIGQVVIKGGPGSRHHRPAAGPPAMRTFEHPSQRLVIDPDLGDHKARFKSALLR